MALITGQPDTADAIDAEYFTRSDPGAPVIVYMHLDALDGIARDTVEAFASLPRRGAEIGGLLLGHVKPGERPSVWIDRYQRIRCAHHFGPQFVLDEEEHKALEDAASAVARDGELEVVGFYRSHTRPGFQLEESDLEMVRRYFNDPADLILLIRPESMSTSAGRFYSRREGSDLEATGDAFAFRGRLDAVAARPAESELDADDIQADTARTILPDRPPAEKMRRIVPDFPQADPPQSPLSDPQPDTISAPEEKGLLRKWLLLAAAILLAGCLVWFLFFSGSNRRENASAPGAGVSTPIRPLGLYVEPSGDNWRVSWNPGATALHEARGVQLFVRDQDDQSRIDLAPKDLQSGTYQYQSKGPDVTFRLEVTEAGGRVSAESFRFLKAAAPVSPPAEASVPKVPVPTSKTTEARIPRAIRRVPPVVPASIRPRIHGSIPIDIRVTVDSRGRVSSALPVIHHAAGLQSYLAERAVFAAKQWRFEARSPGSETIHFVFEK